MNTASTPGVRQIASSAAGHAAQAFGREARVRHRCAGLFGAAHIGDHQTRRAQVEHALDEGDVEHGHANDRQRGAALERHQLLVQHGQLVG
jgi:hypothetical protein